MITSMPVSALTNYNKVLSKVRDGDEVTLTKNGESKYAVIDIAEWQYTKAMLRFLTDMKNADSINKADGRKFSETELLGELGISAG
jgi:prevent-host-death family protein